MEGGKLSALQIAQQICNCGFNVCGLFVAGWGAIFFIILNLLLPSSVIAGDGTVESSSPPSVCDINESAKTCCCIVQFEPRPDIKQLRSQVGADRVGQFVEFLALVQVQGQVMPNERAQQESGAGKEQRVIGRADPSNKEIKHHWPPEGQIFLSGFTIFLFALTSGALGAFAIHALKHGLNNAWRDLVFNWPIPYWMRFVPKDEQ